MPVGTPPPEAGPMKPPPRHLKTGARLMLHPLPLAAALLFALSALLLDGCASHPAPLRGRPDLLSFLADGNTTRTEAISHLGEPSGRFEQERILTYRLGFESRNQGYFVVE